jgi:hypothetical protein
MNKRVWSVRVFLPLVISRFCFAALSSVREPERRMDFFKAVLGSVEADINAALASNQVCVLTAFRGLVESSNAAYP